jgi:origin recognition complex subunit 1
MPGTGKTATIHAAIVQLQQEADEKEIPAFVAAELNALRLPQPTAAFTALWACVKGDQVAPTRARELLDAHFSRGGAGRKPVVCVVDEVDSLVGGRQAVLYALLEWTTRPGARLAVIAVANTMDLPERLLPRLASRAGVRRMVFAPYTHDQLKHVVQARLESLRVFDNEAVELTARKVALVSGDARRALQLARRATEIAEAASAPRVRLAHVQAAVRETEATPAARALAAASLHEVLFLASLCSAITAGPNGITAPIGDVRSTAVCCIGPVVNSRRVVVVG